MDDLELPDIDPALPDPDFFDAEDGIRDVLPLPSIGVNDTASSQTSVQNALLNVVQESALKFDDDLCEYNEFLIGLETNVSSSTTNTVKEAGDLIDGEACATSSSSVAEDTALKAGSEEKEGEEDKPVPVDQLNEMPNAISSSEPNTPDSRSSAIIRLSIPVIGKVSTSRKSPKKAISPRKSPPRVKRVRQNLSQKLDSRSKRKISVSDEEDYEPEAEEDNDEEEDSETLPADSQDSVVRSIRTSRQTRKASRFAASVKEGNGTSRPKRTEATPDSRSRRRVKKVARYGYSDGDDDQGSSGLDDEEKKSEFSYEAEMDSDSEPLAEPKKKRSRKSNHWTDKNGFLHFEDNRGKVTIFKKLSIRVVRLSNEEIAKALGEEPSDEDESENPFLLEVCIDNIDSAEAAVKGGAKRIELCSSLSEGGLTPSGGFLTLVKEQFKDTPVFVMIRPRGGDFVYNSMEIEIMTRDISHYKQMGADGFVFGALTKNCQVDVENCKLLKQMAFPLECTFHRAFDKVDRPMSALETIINLGFSRILTSGQAATAHAGIPTIKRLVEAAGGRIKILAGAGVKSENVGEIVRRTGVTEVHGSASKTVASIMCKPGPSKPLKRGGRKPAAVTMGTTDDSVIKITDSNEVKKIVKNGRKYVSR